HPYAIEVSKNAMTACTQLGINYLRFERPSLITEKMITVNSVKAACKQALNYSGNIYLTTGSKTLADFLKYLPKERIVARVLPTVEVLNAVEKLEIPTGHIEALKGPFSKELNRELLIHNQAGVMITKESGHAGGFLEKTEACKALNIPCIVIQREQLNYPEKFSSIERLIETSKKNQSLTKKEER
ncbi:MAG: precorrin-6A reductase, partial [Enterococcus sp.]